MSGFAGQMRAGDGGSRRGLWLTFLTPFGLEVAGGCGAEWIGIDVQHGDLELTDVAPLEDAVVSAIKSVISRTAGQGRITGIFTGNRELTRLLPAVDLLGVDTDAAALRAGLKQMFGPPHA